MAIITCPKCTTKLQAPDNLPAGRRFTCSKCQQIFTSLETVSDKLPDALFVDDEDQLDDRPRSRRRERDDDDDRPSVGRRRHRDDDDRPRVGRRSRDDDDFDDRPRAGRDEDEPRARPKKKRKRLSPVLLAGGFVGLLMLFVGMGILIYSLVRGGKGSGTDLIAHVPSDSLLISGYDVGRLSNMEAFKQALDRQPPDDLAELDRAGIRLNDVAQALFAQTLNGDKSCVVRFHSAPQQDQYLSAISGKKYANFKSLNRGYQFGYFADSKVLVLADKQTTIQSLVDKNGKAKLNSHLQTMVNRTQGPAWRATGPMTPTERNKFGTPNDNVPIRAGTSQGAVAWLSPTGDYAELQIEIECADEFQAAQIAAVLKSAMVWMQHEHDIAKMFGRPNGFDPQSNEIRNGYAAMVIENVSRRVTARVKLPAAEALRTIGAIRY